MLTEEYLVRSGSPRNGFGGQQLVYRFSDGHGLSFVNSPLLHSYAFAWEAAVLKNVSEDGGSFDLTYDTPLTDDVVVFDSDEEANAFIARAIELFEQKATA